MSEISDLEDDVNSIQFTIIDPVLQIDVVCMCIAQYENVHVRKIVKLILIVNQFFNLIHFSFSFGEIDIVDDHSNCD